MNILIKDNLVYENRSTIDEYDFDLNDINPSKKDLYVGLNGVGKTFMLRVFSSIAYLYSIKDHSYKHNYDIQKVIQNLIDVNIGTLSDENRPLDGLLISHFTSYHEREEKKDSAKKIDSVDDAVHTLNMGAKLVKMLDSYHYIKIGPSAKEFFDTTNVIYYSNSPFPSNEKFFFERASSFDSDSVDVPFWILHRNLPQRKHFEVKIWMNNSLGFTDFDGVKAAITGDRFKERIKYTFRHIFNFYEGFVFDNILENNLFKLIEKRNTLASSNKEKFPYIFYRLDKMDVDDYLVLLMLKECINSFNFEFYYKSIPYIKLNSGRRYNLTLECLKHICNNGKKTLLIIDEPENSLHLTIQRDLAQKKDNLQILLATHSPVFAMSLMNEFPENFILHVLSKKGNVINDELISEKYLHNNSIDEMAAEFFCYAPFLDEWEKLNPKIKPENMIDVNEFYDKLKDLN